MASFHITYSLGGLMCFVLFCTGREILKVLKNIIFHFSFSLFHQIIEIEMNPLNNNKTD